MLKVQESQITNNKTKAERNVTGTDATEMGKTANREVDNFNIDCLHAQTQFCISHVKMLHRFSTARRIGGVRTLAMVSKPALPASFGNFINGKFEEPIDGQYFDNISPIDGKPFIKAARSNQKDISMAVDAASEAMKTWKNVSVTDRSNMLLKIADTIEQNAEILATLETMDNGKAVRETINADLPLVVDHFRYFAGVIRADEGSATELDVDTLSVNIHEPLGVVGLIIPWNFPLLMAAWKLAPALAAGNTMVLKPAEQTPTSIMVCVLLWCGVVCLTFTFLQSPPDFFLLCST